MNVIRAVALLKYLDHTFLCELVSCFITVIVYPTLLMVLYRVYIA